MPIRPIILSASLLVCACAGPRASTPASAAFEVPPGLGPRLLYDAVKDGAETEVRRLLDAGVDPNLKPFNDWTSLHMAAAWARPEITRMLLAHGAEVDRRDANGNAALHILPGEMKHGPSRNETEVARILISAGADVNAVDEDGDSVLARACYYGTNSALVQVLLDAGADPEGSRTGDSAAPLYEATDQVGPEAAAICRLLLEHGAEVDRRTYGDTALHAAVKQTAMQPKGTRAQDVLAVLLAYGADANALDRDGVHPLDLVDVDFDLRNGVLRRDVLYGGGAYYRSDDWAEKEEPEGQ